MSGSLSFHGRGPFTASAAVAVLILILTSLFPVLSSSQGATVIDFSETISVELEDRDENGLAEYLVVKVTVNVFESGTYLLHGSIGGERRAANSGRQALDLGSHMLQLRFSGGDLSLYEVSGHYQLKLELFSTDSSLDPVVKVVTTSETYSADMFEAPRGTGKVSIRSEGDRVYVIGDTLTISVNQTYPQLTFYYTMDEGKGSTSSLTYTTIVAFDDDDDDGVWDEEDEEKKYEGDLTRVDWELDLDVKNGVDISLYGIVQLNLVGTATVAAWARVTFGLSSSLLLETYESQKFDIDIDLWQPLDASNIAVLHTLKDETGTRSIEAGPGEGSQDNNPNQLRVVDDKGRTQNTYSWTEEIMVGYSSLERSSEAETWFSVGNGEADIWFSYPLEGDIQIIHHDPTIGMDPENIPPEPSENDFVGNNLLIMVIGLGIGILVVGATIYSRQVLARKGKGGGS